ncbi:MAG: flagellar biosynthetic protein FliO [Gemmatimonadetes bacterium]|nr:flagellar biosynthetic protein FliO [Gemmatimonadota bacterium]
MPRKPSRSLTAVPAFLLLTPAAALAADSVPPISQMALRAGLSLAVVVAAIFAVALLLRRLSGSAAKPASGRRLASLARLDLGNRRELRIVRADHQVLVLGVTADRIELIRELPADALEDEESPAPALTVLRKLTTSS